MADVLAISVPLGSRYASVNNVGGNSHRAGKKSAAYKQLFTDVKTAAEAEMARTGWQKATAECFTLVVRYIVNRRRADAANQGKCELDALTAAGVWDDDCQAVPFMASVCYAPEGGPRLAIVVVKQRQDMPARKQTPLRRVEAGANAAPYPNSWRPGDPIPEGFAALGSRLVARNEALEMIRK